MIKRNTNIDLFRIIATLFVVMLHVLKQGGILEHTSPEGVNHWVAWFLEICAYCAVNCFALISGYVMVNKNIKLVNIVNLWLQVMFYSLLITVLFFAFLPETRSVRSLTLAIIPILGKQWWYISSYFALYFFIPFLNKAINHLSQQTYKKFLLLVLFGICCLYRIVSEDAFTLNDGFSAVWLMIVYLFGGYIRKYDVHKRITALKSMMGFFAMITLTFISKISIYFITKSIWGQGRFDNALISYTSITIVLSSVFLLLFCLNVKISNTVSKLICFLSPATLGVYLIHVHPLVFEHIIKNAFVSFTQSSPIIMFLYILAATLSIYLLCTVVELLRIQFFKLIRVNKWCEFIVRKFNTFYLKIFKN